MSMYEETGAGGVRKVLIGAIHLRLWSLPTAEEDTRACILKSLRLKR